ncbi:MAG TPA: LLM class flavin-dependent oxidoreductase [Thermomicrobiales bacterium]|jgi:alkanesulfonate monooxygenase SsuD/methylene tetrahydromethanopterin reductase-like flavin-dependent oxidoreductase (luciferase family)
MSISLGLFDIMQIDPTDPTGHGEVYRRRLDDLAFADEIGLDVAFTAERHFLANYRASAPNAWLGAASQRTRRIRLGVLAYTLPLHSPVRLAEEVAVLDHLSSGRLEVGLGLGHRPEELVATGVDPTRRIPIFQERLAIMQALWSGGQVAIESEYDTVREVAINPTPLQEPHPPLWYAGGSPDATGWAGSYGLSLAVGFAPLRDLVPATAAFKAGYRSRRQDPDEATPPGAGRIALMRHLYVAESDERAKTEMTDDLLRLHELRQPAVDGDRTERRAAAAAEADRLIRDEIYFAGGPETVARGIAFAHRTLGVDLFLGNPYAAGIDDERVRRTMRLLAGDVARALAEIAAEPTPDSAG